MKLFLLTVLLFCATSFSFGQFKVNSIDVGIGYSKTSVNTAIFRTNAICSLSDTQFIAYYDTLKYLVIGKRHINPSRKNVEPFELTQTKYFLNKGNDAHNVISIELDGKGYLHVCYDQHSSKLNYCTSVEPFSTKLSMPKLMITKNLYSVEKSESVVTYPEFYRLSNGDLFFVYRFYNDLVVNRYDCQNKNWNRCINYLLMNLGRSRPYWQIYLGTDDDFNISWLWRMNEYSTLSNKDIFYMRSKDYLRSFENINGNSVNVPVKLENNCLAWAVGENRNLINQTSICTDGEGHPYIATYFSTDSVTDYHLIYHDGDSWKDVKVSNRSTTFNLNGIGTLPIPISRPKVLVDNNYIYYFVRDSERGSVVTMYYAKRSKKNKKLKFSVQDLTKYSVGAWEPCVDMDLWKSHHKIHLFVQQTFQVLGDTRNIDSSGTMVRLLEIIPKKR